MNNNIITTNLKNLYFAKFTFTAEVTKDIYLPGYKGITFRDSLVYSFKNLVCFYPHQKDCEVCKGKSDCSFYKIFKAKIDKEIIDKFSLREGAPRPYVIEPPDETNKFYSKGDKFSFNLILIGWAINYFTEFRISFERIGWKYGIGGSTEVAKGKFKIINIVNNRKTIYPGYNIVNSSIKPIKIKATFKENISYLQINFITPTQIIVNKELIKLDKSNSFTTFILWLYRRLFMQHFIYCKGSNIKYNHETIELRDLADKVELTDSNLGWFEIERVKNKTDDKNNKTRKMNMSGFMGEVSFMGNITPFMEMIKIGEFLHIGKNYTFGEGKYEIINYSSLTY